MQKKINSEVLVQDWQLLSHLFDSFEKPELQGSAGWLAVAARSMLIRQVENLILTLRQEPFLHYWVSKKEASSSRSFHSMENVQKMLCSAEKLKNEREHQAGRCLCLHSPEDRR